MISGKKSIIKFNNLLVFPLILVTIQCVSLRRRAMPFTVTSSGIPRVWQHLSQNEFGIMSAFRSDKDMDTNLKNDSELKSYLVSNGLGFIPAQGVWKGDSENSIIIPSISKDEIAALAKKYNQMAFIYGNNGQWTLFDTNTGGAIDSGSVKDSFHILNEQEVQDSQNKDTGYTQLDRDKNRPFSLQKAADFKGNYFVHTIAGLPYFARRSRVMKAVRFDGTNIYNDNGTVMPISWVGVFIPLN